MVDGGKTLQCSITVDDSWRLQYGRGPAHPALAAINRGPLD